MIVSTNLKVRQDGLPASSQAQPADAGAAIYFQLNGKARVLACDKWERVEHNILAVARHIEALRGQQRWGVGSVEQAFAGYAALPERATIRQWWDVLAVDPDADIDTIASAYRKMAKVFHPDRGGNGVQMAELNAAYELACSISGNAPNHE